MSTEVLEQRLNDLQRRVADLEAKISTQGKASVEDLVGAAKGDDCFDEAMKLGAEWRQKANREEW